CHQYNDNLLTF
nr:immunoglobulin light chain junction region [Macaca mulatta]